jgi:hypothetical protein
MSDIVEILIEKDVVVRYVLNSDLGEHVCVFQGFWKALIVGIWVGNCLGQWFVLI